MRQIRLTLTVLVAVICLLFSLLPSVEAASKIYWTDAQTGKIQRANPDGSGIEDLVTGFGVGNPRGIALDVDSGKMYWAASDMQRANLDGTGVENLVGSVGAVGIDLDLGAGKMYWTDVFVSGKIQRSNLDGTGVEDLVTNSQSEGIALDVAGGKMYWTDRGFKKIRRANLDGTGIEDLITTGLIDPREIALDIIAGKMYWAETGTDKIQRANLDGSGVEDLVTGLGNPSGIALDIGEGKMYWTDFSTDKIQRANLDGSAVEDLIVGLGNPSGIALEFEPAPTEIEVTIDIKPGSCPNPLNVKSKGVLPVAVLGTEDFDVELIDPLTIQLSREGYEEGVAPFRSDFEDVATPYDGELCDCHDLDGDGYLDLTLKFKTKELLETLGLDALAGDTILLTITGNLKENYGGAPIMGQDCVWVLEQVD